MKALVNPLLMLIGVLLLAAAVCASGAEASRADALYACGLGLCATCTIVNGALGLARALTKRPSLPCVGWAVGFLVIGCCAWAVLRNDAALGVSGEERTVLADRVKAWKAGECDAYATDENGDSVLILAAGLGKEALLSQILADKEQAQAHVDALAQAAVRAAQRNRTEALKILIEAGVPASASVDGQTLLHAAVLERARSATEYLLAQGAPVNAADAEGATPLHHAVVADDLDLVQLLMRHGADPRQTDAQGRDAASYARTETMAAALAGKEEQP